MGDHFIDTEIKLGQCNRCQGYVFLAMSAGLRSAADCGPVTREAYIAALTEGRRLFRLSERAGRPYKLLTPEKRHLNPSFDQSGAQMGAQRFLAEHGCGGRARNMLTFQEIPQGPHQAPATPGRPRGGNHPGTAPVAGAVTSSPAGHANRPPSKPCGMCGKYIKDGVMYWGIQHGSRWIYCEHEECP